MRLSRECGGRIRPKIEPWGIAIVRGYNKYKPAKNAEKEWSDK